MIRHNLELSVLACLGFQCGQVRVEHSRLNMMLTMDGLRKFLNSFKILGLVGNPCNFNIKVSNLTIYF